MKLEFKVQTAFKDFFLTDTKEILKHRSVFNPEIEYFVPYGGRGSGKTWTFSDALVVEGSLRPVRILVARELQNSIEESIKAEIEASISNRNLHHFYEIQNNVIKGRNGTRFIFKGLKNNITNLKSISDVDIVLVEEAENVSKNSWDKFLPSIRPRDQATRGGMPIVIVIFNPDDELDDTYDRFITNTPPKCVSRLINYKQNKYFPEHLDRQRIHFKKTRPKKDYNNVWLGKPKGSDDNVIIDRDWVRAARFLSRHELFHKVGKKVVGYDPAGQGRDNNAVSYMDGNILKHVEEWLKSKDLRAASERAFSVAEDNDADIFRYDECGGFGDGVAVFVNDAADENPVYKKKVNIDPFNAGEGVINKKKKVPGNKKTFGDICVNAKSEAHMIYAQLLYNSYRFAVLNEHDIPMGDLISIDIEDDQVFNKLVKELSGPIWIRSKINSKKQVESKEDMEKRTGQTSPNIADSAIMCKSPLHNKSTPMLL